MLSRHVREGGFHGRVPDPRRGENLTGVGFANDRQLGFFVHAIPMRRFGVAAELVNDMDLLRLKANAKLLARGLAPEVQWWDLLQEAFARVLSGHRGRPPDVPVDAFITGVMRSIRSQYWRRMSRGSQENATEISANGFSKTTYDSARKRMRRTLLREGLRVEFRP